MSYPPATSPFRQPRAVWVVAFACVVSFMGIGLVDPILPALAGQLQASPSQVSLLFTSYLLVTAVAMLVTGWVSSRVGAKRTLIIGLALIIVFAALAGASGSIAEIVSFRAGWGLGNALFIATSLAVIVGSARGGFAGAIVLYETALGVGIAVGPLLGGLLGAASWRLPFFGRGCLMSAALALVVLLVAPGPRPVAPTGFAEPLRALRHRGLLTLSLMAFAYNWGFFTLLAYSPYPMELGAIELGLVFTGWGAMVALFAVFGAPWLQARLGTVPALYLSFGLLAVDLLVIALFTDSRIAIVVAVIAAGATIGVNNTLVTQAVMTVSDAPRPVASAAYSFVRFLGGGLAPFVAGRLGDAFGLAVPFFVGAAALVLAGLILASGARQVSAAEAAETASEEAEVEREALTEPVS